MHRFRISAMICVVERLAVFAINITEEASQVTAGAALKRFHQE